MKDEERRTAGAKRGTSSSFVLHPCLPAGKASALLLLLLTSLTATPAALGDLLPNELPGDSLLTVTVRGAVGNYYRPGRGVILEVTIQNEGEEFHADVRVGEKRSRGEAVFRGSRRERLAKGSSSREILAAPAGGAAGTVLEVLRVSTEHSDAGGEPVFRGDLSNVLRPLDRNRRLVLAVGLRAFPAPPWKNGSSLSPEVTVAIEPAELPHESASLGTVWLVVLEAVDRSSVSVAATRALVDYVRGGGQVVFASFRALGAFERELFGARGSPPRSLDDLGRLAPAVCVVEGRPGVIPDRVEFSFGQGRIAVFAAEPGDGTAWASARKALAEFVEGFFAEQADDLRVDPRVFEELVPERPFRAAADRASTVALVGALVACVVVALFVTRRRPVAAAALGGVALLWTTVAVLVWDEPDATSRVVRVRAFTGDGRAEVVTDTMAVFAFGEGARFSLETSSGPPLPVAHREGELLGVPYRLAREGDSWLVSELHASRGMPAVVRSRTARRPDAESESLRTRTLARGDRVRVETLPGGKARLRFEGEEPPADVRYLLETFAPPGEELAWLWIEGEPEGVHAESVGRLDPAPGSGTLVIAAAPCATASHRGHREHRN